MGDVPLAMLSVKEIGECVHQIFRNPEEYKNKKVGLSGDSMKIEEYAAVLSKALEPKKFADGHVSIHLNINVRNSCTQSVRNSRI